MASVSPSITWQSAGRELRAEFLRFPLGRVLVRAIVATIPLFVALLLGGWWMLPGAIVTVVLSYFLILMTLYRCVTPWRRIGHQGFTIWIKMLSVRVVSAPKNPTPAVRIEVWKDALTATLRELYSNLERENAQALTEAYLQEVLGTRFEEVLVQQLELNRMIRGFSDSQLDGSIERHRQIDSLGSTLVIFTLGEIVGLHFGQEQKNLFWAAALRGQVCVT